MKKIFLGVCLFIAFSCFAEILSDSTFQATGNWKKNEKRSYSITKEKYKITARDTTAKDVYSCDAEITITDSTADSYTIEWVYKNYSFSPKDEKTGRLLSLKQNVKILIKTDHEGSFQEVLNSDEIIRTMSVLFSAIKKEYKEPAMQKMIFQIESTFSSKESIEAAAIDDILQFFSFMGEKYVLGKQNIRETKTPNPYGGEPFDTKTTYQTDEINQRNKTATLQSNQVVDPEQLTTATFAYAKKLFPGQQLDPNEKHPLMKNNTMTTSVIDNSGWLIHSFSSREISALNILNVENTTIKIK